MNDVPGLDSIRKKTVNFDFNISLNFGFAFFTFHFLRNEINDIY